MTLSARQPADAPASPPPPLAGHAEVLERIAAGAPLGEVLQALTAMIERHAGGMLASVLLADAAGERLVHGAAPSLPATYNAAIDGLQIGPVAGSCGTAAYRREPVVVADVLADPLCEPYRELATEHGIGACWSTPIVDADGELLGTFALYYRSPREPRPDDLRLIEVATQLARIAIERDRMERGQAQLAGLVERTTDFVALAGEDGRLLYINHAGCAMVGVDAAEVRRLSIADLLPERARDHLATVVLPTAEREGMWRGETPLLARDGREIPTSHVVIAHRDAAGRLDYYSTIARDLTAELQAAAAMRLYEHERAIAETLQRSLLPQDLPRVPGVDVAVRYLPGTAGVEVGGDFYDVLALPGGRVGVVIGDVVGRGVQAAAGMGQLRMALRVLAMDAEPPSSALQRLDRLAAQLLKDQMATVVYLILDPATGTAAFANAGHPPPLLIAGGDASFVEGERALPLGAMPGVRYTDTEVTLPAGATLLLYTDGLVDHRDLQILDGMWRLQAAAGGEGAGLEDLCSQVVTGLLPDGPSDDVALLALRRDGA